MSDSGGRTPTIEELTYPILLDAQRAGLLGKPPIESQIAHSLALALVVPASASRLADLGSGAGLPGLVVALARPDLAITLIESSERRADHLRRAVRRLDIAGRCDVDGRPVELVGRDAVARESFDVVVARSFAGPATLAECAVPLLEVNGHLVVAEPPDDNGDRWNALESTDLPLTLVRVVSARSGTFAVLHKTGPCPDRFPRSAGVPFRRPLFT